MQVRGGEFVAQDDEVIDLDGSVRLNPVLRGLEAVVNLPPRLLATGEAGRVGDDDDLPFRHHGNDGLMEPLPDGRPYSTSVLATLHGVMWNGIEMEVLSEQFQEHLELTEGGVEQPAHKEGDQQVAFLHRWSSGELAPLPEWDFIGQFHDPLHRQMQIDHQPLAVSGTTRY